MAALWGMRLFGLACCAGAVYLADRACTETAAWAAVITFGASLALLGAAISILKASRT